MGNESFVTETKERIGYKAIGRAAIEKDGTFEFRESAMAYNSILGIKMQAQDLEMCFRGKFLITYQYDDSVRPELRSRLARHGAGVRMQVSTTSPRDMTDAIVANLGVEVSYPEIPVNGAYLAARCAVKRAGIRDLEEDIQNLAKLIEKDVLSK